MAYMAGHGVSLAAHTAPAPLPTGPCNYKDCGCEQFWDKCSANLHQGSKEHKSLSERSTWCVCEHHACFHKRAAPFATTRAPLACDSRCRRLDARCDVHKPLGLRYNEMALDGGRTTGNVSLEASDAAGSQHVQDLVSESRGPVVNVRGHADLSQPGTSSLPRVPSVCLLTNDRYPAANAGAQEVQRSRQTIAGLGLSMMNLETVGTSTNRPQSVASTIPDDLDLGRFFNTPHNEHNLPSTISNSVVAEQAPPLSPVQGPLKAIQQYNRLLHLDVSGDTVPNTLNVEDHIPSATEVATPSNANTPDLAIADQHVQEAKEFIEGVLRHAKTAQQSDQADARAAASEAVSSPQLLLTNSPNVDEDHVQQIIRPSSPQVLQKLLSYLRPLHNLLNSMPNVSHTMEELNGRLALLENNNSFNYVQPDDLQQHFEVLDGRLVDLENRMDEHDKLHQAIDQDQSSHSHSRRGLTAVAESFGSNCSIQSSKSSALILAGLNSKEVESSIGGIRDRLDVLEAAAMPTSLNPWELEVILLPWGRDLRGIWFAPDEPMHDFAQTTTQDSEEWTQARGATLGKQPQTSRKETETDSSPIPNSRHSSKSSHLFSDTESGWSSQAISEWAAGTADEFLSPKACGSNGLVYHRLRSRGFIKTVTLTSASARDIQATLSRAFDGLLEHLKYSPNDDNPIVNTYPGLRASFVPLRKVIKDSRLRFLTPPEMASSALWSAQFLSSGVMMRVTGGKKRLYVTQREAYIQSKDEMGSSWDWQELRQLPRCQPDSDSRMDGNEEQCQPQVAEADARESCWSFVAAYDAPPSINASFGSHQSAELELSMRPSDRDWRRSMTPTSILRNRQPISPLSEFHPQRPGFPRNRTASASMIEPATTASAKRRLNSSPVKQSSAPQPSSRAPSTVLTRPKRRRVTQSSSPNAKEELPVERVAAQTTTPRRSHDPPSPFFSSEPQVFQVPRTNSDLASRPSQRSVAVVGKNTPFAYATPHSGLFEARHDGGDTEPDDNDSQDDDGEQSWRGVATGDSGGESSADGSDEQGEEEQVSFSADEEPAGSEDDAFDSGDDDDFFGDEELENGQGNGDDPLDTLLHVIKSYRS